METSGKKSKFVKIIKESNPDSILKYDFFSFDEKRTLENKVIKVEEELKTHKNFIDSLKQNFEKKLLQKDIEFHELLDQTKNQSYDQGEADGHKKGYTEGEASVLKANEYLKNCAESVLQKKSEILFSQESNLLKLITKISEKVINSTLEVDNEIILGTIKKSLNLISDKSILKIRLSSSDLQIAEENLEMIKSLYVEIKNIDLIIDNRVSKGGVIIETAGGTIDARFETQIEEVYQALLSSAKED